MNTSRLPTDENRPINLCTYSTSVAARANGHNKNGKHTHHLCIWSLSFALNDIRQVTDTPEVCLYSVHKGAIYMFKDDNMHQRSPLIRGVSNG